MNTRIVSLFVLLLMLCTLVPVDSPACGTDSLRYIRAADVLQPVSALWQPEPLMPEWQSPPSPPLHFADFRFGADQVLAGGIGLALTALSFALPDCCAPPDTAQVALLTADSMTFIPFMDALDRSAIGNYSGGAASASDMLLLGITVAPVVHGLYYLPELDRQPGTAPGRYVGVYAQAVALNLGLNMLVKNLVCRPRPFVYNNKLDNEAKFASGRDMFRSFYSGHTSTTFMAAVFLTKTYADLNPDKKGAAWAVGTLSMASAALTGYLRYAAGRHFPSDIISGALVGGAIGFLVPALN